MASYANRTSFNGSTARSPWYGSSTRATRQYLERLQWVHGSLAVVSSAVGALATRTIMLQWVHGSLAVVWMFGQNIDGTLRSLQWVHGSLAVVWVAQLEQHRKGKDASMGPRLARRGMECGTTTYWSPSICFNGSTARSPWYGRDGDIAVVHQLQLQWVHGSLAVVWVSEGKRCPLSESFNGSTARSPWYG